MTCDQNVRAKNNFFEGKKNLNSSRNLAIVPFLLMAKHGAINFSNLF